MGDGGHHQRQIRPPDAGLRNRVYGAMAGAGLVAGWLAGRVAPLLRRVVGSDAIMARQLRALLEAADRPNVRLWVVPFGVGGRVGFDCSFYIINFPHEESVVQLASKRSDVYLEDKADIDFFQDYAAKLGKIALDPAKSVALVASIARGYEQK